MPYTGSVALPSVPNHRGQAGTPAHPPCRTRSLARLAGAPDERPATTAAATPEGSRPRHEMTSLA